MDDLTTERIFDSQATWVFAVFGLFIFVVFRHVIHGLLYKQALADVRSSGVGMFVHVALPYYRRVCMCI